LPGIYSKIVTVFDVGTGGRQSPRSRCPKKPFLRKFRGTVIDIFSFKGPHKEDFSRCKSRLERRIKVGARIGLQGIGIASAKSHFRGSFHNGSFFECYEG